jgi:hypothetical protein
MWRVVRYFTKKRDNMPPLMQQGTQYSTADQKAPILAQQFENNHNLTVPQQINKHTQAVERTVDKFLSTQKRNNEEIPTILESEVRTFLLTLKPRTAPGHDGITNTLLRNLPATGITDLTTILNSSLHLGHFSEIWKHATVLAIVKPHRPPTSPGSYRPISLLPAIEKVLERIVTKRLNQHALESGTIPNEQFGFRKKHSTTSQLTRLTDYITHGYNIKKHTGLLTLDLEKVWIKGLLFKLINFNFPPYLIFFLSSYLRNRSFSVVITGASSPTKYPEAGLPQGAALSPILFTFYTVDFP